VLVAVANLVRTTILTAEKNVPEFQCIVNLVATGITIIAGNGGAHTIPMSCAQLTATFRLVANLYLASLHAIATQHVHDRVAVLNGSVEVLFWIQASLVDFIILFEEQQPGTDGVGRVENSAIATGGAPQLDGKGWFWLLDLLAFKGFGVRGDVNADSAMLLLLLLLMLLLMLLPVGSCFMCRPQ
jgi:hypothetical protein